MCDASSTAEHLALVHEARVAADDLLGGYLRLPVAKALDLRTPRGFDRAVARLAALLRTRASASEQAALRAALQLLDVDWSTTTAASRRSLIAQASRAAALQMARVPGAIRVVLTSAATDTVHAARDGVRRGQRLTIAADFNAVDHRIIRHLVTSEANYARDAYGVRSAALSEKAREVVAAGLEAGLGRDDIAQDLAAAARALLLDRSPFYWDVVASAFTGRARSYGQLSSYAEAGIERYVIEAVLDERTTPVCRFLHGKSFTVKSGLDRFDEVEQAPERLKELSPWVRDAVDETTGKRLLYVKQGDARVPIAEVVRSGEGTRDDRGEFARGRSERTLTGLGIGFPPYHGLCRTTTLADV